MAALAGRVEEVACRLLCIVVVVGGNVQVCLGGNVISFLRSS